MAIYIASRIFIVALVRLAEHLLTISFQMIVALCLLQSGIAMRETTRWLALSLSLLCVVHLVFDLFVSLMAISFCRSLPRKRSAKKSERGQVEVLHLTSIDASSSLTLCSTVSSSISDNERNEKNQRVHQ
jgi:hypothetical protein